MDYNNRKSAIMAQFSYKLFISSGKFGISYSLLRHVACVHQFGLGVSMDYSVSETAQYTIECFRTLVVGCYTEDYWRPVQCNRGRSYCKLD
ncbi:hypothetical protein M2408_002268 [Sphingobacterium sp. BIGb0165]|nr:hypothetical protein [Sphingobacterium sp. BIGb0165]